MGKFVAALVGTLVCAQILTLAHACPTPSCSSPGEWDILHPAADRAFFYQCAPAAGGGFRAVLMPCAPGTWFGFAQQLCVWPNEWVDVCGGIGTTPNPPTTTTTPVTVTTTTTTTALPTTTTTTITLPTTTTGAPDTTQSTTTTTTFAPPLQSCRMPDCNVDNVLILHPSLTPTMFYQCVLTNGIYTAVEQMCQGGLFFGFIQQGCVSPVDWINVCNDGGTTSIAPEPTSGPGMCGTPLCVGDEIHRLHPTTDRNFFYQCAPAPGGGWRAMRMPCASGTWFGYRQQVCVWPQDWQDPCN